MIICKEFIVLNLPKTGSTFVRKVIKEIYDQRYSRQYLSKIGIKFKLINPPLIELILPNFQSPNPYQREIRSQHGSYCQIPKEFLNKKVVTVIRSPFERLLSGYEYKWWEKKPPIERKYIDEFFPSFPHLNLNEYISLKKLSVEDNNPADLGTQSIQFIRMFFKNPEDVLTHITKDYIESEDAFKKDIGDITFLRQENLNEELSTFLYQQGFSKKEAEFAKNYGKVNVTKPTGTARKNLWTKEAVEYVTENERFLLKMLKNMGFEYKVPEI